MKAKIRLAALAFALCFPQPAAAGGGVPPEDQANIEKFLGKGVLGENLLSDPIADAKNFFPIENRAWTFRFTSGPNKGRTEQDSFTRLKRDQDNQSGRYDIGPDESLFLRWDDAGNLVAYSQQDKNEGVIIRYDPPEPIYIKGVKPGEVRHSKMKVKVYDLAHPDHLTHSGSLAVTYSYLGAYKVHVPAGTYDAALIKWDFEGDIGPASISDLQYRFLVEGIGTVATIEKKDISALLIYHNHQKFGKVLVSED